SVGCRPHAQPPSTTRKGKFTVPVGVHNCHTILQDCRIDSQIAYISAFGGKVRVDDALVLYSQFKDKSAAMIQYIHAILDVRW
ncbi:9531_t:CDS:1, partial [Acaulospora colombiana]